MESAGIKPLSCTGKKICVTLCSFCRNAVIGDGISCSLRLHGHDRCPDFMEVEDAASRLRELAKKMPERYGAIIPRP